jgi:hypothetical protein
MKQADSVQISPDGHHLAYTVDGEIWIVATQAGSIPRKVGKGAVPEWSPDSTHLAYYSTQSGTFQLWWRDILSGQTKQMTHLERGIRPDPLTRLSGYSIDPLIYGWAHGINANQVFGCCRLYLAGKLGERKPAMKLLPVRVSESLPPPLPVEHSSADFAPNGRTRHFQ